MSAFILHCGSREVPRQELALVPVPEARGIYRPVPHEYLATSIKDGLEAGGFEITAERHALNKDGAQYFGFYQVVGAGAIVSRDYSIVVGFRSSYDFSLAIRIALGSQVFVCDNLAFSGDVEVFRKHTTNVFRDVPTRIGAAVEKLPGLIINQGEQFSRWQATPIEDQRTSDHIIGELYRRNVVTRSLLPRIYDEFEEPAYDHGPKTLWRMFNTVTEVLKKPSDTNLVQLPQRTQRLTRVINGFAEELKQAA